MWRAMHKRRDFFGQWPAERLASVRGAIFQGIALWLFINIPL
jgi:hypothetical protein